MEPELMSKLTVALETLGCKVNQYESSHFLDSIREAGWQAVSFRDRADVYIVHSCAVTSKAGFQTRQLLRRAQRINPEAKVALIGCNAQLDADRIADARLATHIIGNNEKFELLRWLKEPGGFSDPFRILSDPRGYGELKPLPVTRMHSARARAFLKVQDGCDTFCSYCIVPYTRGRSRSLAADEVCRQMERFLTYGYREVVLTGIHLGQWGKDLPSPRDLFDLLTRLAEGPLPPRIRLSSLEPMEWSERILGQLHSWPWICPHFHVPLQSGDEEILKRMHRPYTPRRYAEVIEELHRLFPDAALGADVMVGFPGESDRHFRNTFELIESLPLTYLHVFPFSPRPGTLAARWPQRATGGELKRRAQALQALGGRKREAFRNRFLGRRVEVLVETEVKPGWWQGTSHNYLQVRFSCAHLPASGSIETVHLTRLTEKGLTGQAC
jgi:threonylcarbamoyladenosine tRNA methylthiotransferase MtaB